MNNGVPFYTEEERAFKANLWGEKLAAISFLISSIHRVPARLACSLLPPGKGSVLDKGRARGSKGQPGCQRTQPDFGTLAYSTRWPAGAARWPACDILFRIMGPGSVPGSALWAEMTEVEHVCCDSSCNHSVAVAFNIVHGAFSGFQRIWTMPRQGRTEDRLLFLFLSNKGTE